MRLFIIEMPNDCWNHITITANKEELETLIQKEFSKYDNKDLFSISEKGAEGVRIRLWSAWYPQIEWLESLLTNYPSCWVKNEWIVEDGQAGIWIGTAREGEKEVRQFIWDDMCWEEIAHRFRES